MIRTYDAAVHNFIANHPEVKPNLTMPGIDPNSPFLLDFSECAERPDHYILLHNDTRDGALLFDWSGPGMWEMHSLFLPSCRGRSAIKSARTMLDYMFEEEDAFCVWGQTPLSNKAAAWFNRQLGGKLVGTGDHYAFGPCEHYRLSRAEWETLRAK